MSATPSKCLSSLCDTPTDGFIACRHTSCGLRCVCGAFVEGRVTFALVSDVFLGVSDSVAGVRDTLGIVSEVRGTVTMVSDVLPEVRGTVVRVRGGVALVSVGCGTLAEVRNECRCYAVYDWNTVAWIPSD